MNKKTGIVFVALGAVLLMAALLLALYNEYVDLRAGESSHEILEELQTMIDKRILENREAERHQSESVSSLETTETQSIADAVNDEKPTEDPPSEQMYGTMLVGGYECIGYLDIPKLDLLLPVLSDWDYSRLNAAPCRHFGSVFEDNLVIAGHNYKRHFSYLSKLSSGDEVKFCDTDGTVHEYTVASVENVNADAVDSVQNSGHALVLYTCTFVGDVRAVVFCDRVGDV